MNLIAGEKPADVYSGIAERYVHGNFGGHCAK